MFASIHGTGDGQGIGFGLGDVDPVVIQRHKRHGLEAVGADRYLGAAPAMRKPRVQTQIETRLTALRVAPTKQIRVQTTVRSLSTASLAIVMTTHGQLQVYPASLGRGIRFRIMMSTRTEVG